MRENHKEVVRDIFDRAAIGYGEKGCAFFDYFGERLVSLAQLTPGEKILDVATGKGAVLLPAAEVVGESGAAVGVDLSLNMVQEARKKTPHPWIDVRQMDAEELAFPDCSFDVVFCAFALFFFPNLNRALAEFRRVLKPGGRLAVSVWGKRSELDAWVVHGAQNRGVVHDLGVISLRTAEALKEQLKNGGFSSMEIYEEQKVFLHGSAEAWWESLWSHATRWPLEQLAQEDLESLKREAIIRAGPGPVRDDRHVFYAIVREGNFL